MSEIRSVSVRLDADVAGYIAKMKLAGAATDRAFGRSSAGITSTNSALSRTETTLDKVDVSARKASTAVDQLGNRVESSRVKVDTGAKSIDRYSGRIGLLGDTILGLGPALVPVAAEAVPAVAALGTNFLFAAAGAGTALLAFHGVGDALTKLNKAAIDPTDANLKAARLAMQQLPPAAQEFTLQLQALRPELQGLQRIAANGLLPGAGEGLQALTKDLPIVRQDIRAISGELGTIASDTGQALSSNRWQPFLRFVGREAPIGLGTMAHATGDVVHGLAELVMAFNPLTHDVDRGLVNLAEDFDRWASSVGRTKGFQDFLAYLEANGPRVLHLLGDTASTLLDIARAAAPLGGPVIDALDAIARIVGVIADSNLGTPLFTGILAMRLMTRTTQLWGQVGESSAGKFIAGQKAAVVAIRATASAEQRAAMSAQELAAAQQRTTAGWSTIRGGALKAGGAAAGFGLIASGVTDKLHLTNTATLAMAGSLAGPWGAAIGGGIGLVLDFAHKQDNSAAATTDFTSTLNEQTGAITGNTRALAAQVLQQDGAFELANQLGVGLDTVTSAALGNKDALAELNGQLSFFLQQSTPGYSAGGTSVIDPKQAAAARELQQELGLVGGSISDDQAKTRELSAAMGHNADSTSQAARAHHKLQAELEAERTAADATAKKFVTLGDDLDNAKVSLNQWIHQLAAQAQALTNFGNNAKRAADKGLRHGLIDALNEAGPAGAMRMRQLANATQSQIDRANHAWASGQQAIQAYNNQRVETKRVSVDISLALARIAQIRAQIDSIHSKTVSINVTGGHITQQPGSADGSTVPGPRQPYGDKVLMPVAPGEEIISNRYGQADRNRVLLKKINAGGMADGGTVPTHVTTTQSGAFMDGRGVGAAAAGATRELHGLRLEAHNLTQQSKDLSKAFDAEKQKRDNLISAEQQLVSTVAEGFQSQIFGATADGGVWASGATTDPARILRQNIRDARAYEHDIRVLRRRGLRGGALAEVTTLADAQQALGLSAREDRQISHLFNVRRRASQAAGATAGNLRFGRELDQANRHLAHLRGEVQETNHRLHQVEAAIKHHEAEAKKNADHTGKTVADGINGTARNAARRAH
jgi:hypothetical protein